MTPWSTADIADAVAAGLQAQAAADDLEQAVYGFDARDELGLHPLIQSALRRGGWGVYPEQRYPQARAYDRKSEGKRCDVVLTSGPPLADPTLTGTLFAAATPVTEPEDAYWLEIKTVAQYEIGGPFRRYSAELLSPVAQDVRKITSDERIRHGGLLLVLFCVDQAVAEHDLGAWYRKCTERGLCIAYPAIRGFRITDRIGNGWCAMGVFGIRGV